VWFQRRFGRPDFSAITSLGRIDLDVFIRARDFLKDGVGVMELSRLLSRICHRQFGILVTTLTSPSTPTQGLSGNVRSCDVATGLRQDQSISGGCEPQTALGEFERGGFTIVEDDFTGKSFEGRQHRPPGPSPVGLYELAGEHHQDGNCLLSRAAGC
jgi:hypothetical protein